MNQKNHVERIPLDRSSRAILVAGALLGRTWRTTLADPFGADPFHDHGRGRIYAFWHAHLLILSFFFRNSDKTAVVSESRDGKRAAAIAQRWGHSIIQGSSSRGGFHVLRSCAAELRKGGNIVITPDGPRGPAREVKPGVAQISLVTGAPVIPVSAVAAHAWHLGSWDRFCIPKPFSRITIHLGEPLYPQLSTKENDGTDHLTRRIQKALSAW